MAGSGKLYITISDERGGGGGSTPIPKPSDGSKKDNGDILGRYVEHEMFHLAKAQVTKAVNFAIGNVGNFTGDYITQNKINNMRSSLSGFMNIGMATIAGAKVGGWVGALVGFTIGTISEVSSGVYDTIAKSNENAKTNYEIAQLRDRAGLNTLLDGSRGTEN